MPITAITIENFKGIRDPVRVEFKPITLLFGPNSVGKSTIVQALHYAREIFERENVDPGRTLAGGAYVDLGGFENLVTNHDLSHSISLQFDLDLKDVDLPNYLPEDIDQAMDEIMVGQVPAYVLTRIQAAWVKIVIKWNSWQGKPLIYSYEVGLNELPLVRIEASADGRQIFLSYLNLEHPVFLDEETPDDSASESLLTPLNDPSMIESFQHGTQNVNFAIGGQNSALPTWGHFLQFEDEPWEQLFEDWPYRLDLDQFFNFLTRVVVGPGQLIRDALRQFRYIGPLREVPPRDYEPARSPDESRWATGVAAWDILREADQGLLDSLNKWLRSPDRLNAGYHVEVKYYKELALNSPIMLAFSEGRLLDESEWIREKVESLPTKSRVFLRQESNDIEVLPQDVGVGLVQMIPVTVAGLYSRSGIVVIEQPELHIHPALQVALGDLFISQIQDKDVFFLLETHSEHLMLRLLRRIRETAEGQLPPGKWPLEPGQLAVYYVEQGDQGITVSKIRIDKEGEFVDRWPKGFFEEREEELLY